ncbi:AAA family ATPase [Pseudomonas sp. Leaf127]|uniref:AAA family ATPase n=1 Tax=Pseudomonas sp. Leaf127 TaxID=1736267 RepID=UPI0022A968DB|nr:AAA family ATPase [Pseudomonas sp. Leaf127]
MTAESPDMLIVFSGLPGTGKTTLARRLAMATEAVYLRIDTIEQAIRTAAVLAHDVGTSGYDVANALALSNLQLGRQVIVDGVNPVRESRQAWHTTAQAAGVALVNIQVVCSDAAEHRRRVETRKADIAGLTPPDWASVLRHEYEPWEEMPFTLDTAQVSVEHAVALLAERFFRRQLPGFLNAPPEY